MATTYKSNSNYSRTTQNKKFLNYYVPPLNTSTLQPDSSIVLRAKHHKRPDILSSELYGTPRLWWVFRYYNVNSLRDPVNDFVSGLEISYPNKATIEGLI